MPAATKHTRGTLEEHCIDLFSFQGLLCHHLFSEHRTFVRFLSLCYSVDSGEKVAETDDNI